MIALGIFALVVVGIVLFRYWWIHDTVMHPVYCLCQHCDRYRIEQEIMRREWAMRGDEIRRAVDELSQDTRR